jgi:hypothetical protein
MRFVWVFFSRRYERGPGTAMKEGDEAVAVWPLSTRDGPRAQMSCCDVPRPFPPEHSIYTPKTEQRIPSTDTFREDITTKISQGTHREARHPNQDSCSLAYHLGAP